MRDTLEEIIMLQADYSASKTPAMERRGHLIRNVLPREIEEHSAALRLALGAAGEDAVAEEKDNQGRWRAYLGLDGILPQGRGRQPRTGMLSTLRILTPQGVIVSQSRLHTDSKYRFRGSNGPGSYSDELSSA